MPISCMFSTLLAGPRLPEVWMIYKKLEKEFKVGYESVRRDQEACKDIWSRQEENGCGIRGGTDCSFYVLTVKNPLI